MEIGHLQILSFILVIKFSKSMARKNQASPGTFCGSNIRVNRTFSSRQFEQYIIMRIYKIKIWFLSFRIKKFLRIITGID